MTKCTASILIILSFAAFAAATEDFNNPFTPDANTMGLWHFDEVTGSNTAYDATSNNNDGVLDTGATMYGYGPLDPDVSWAAGKFDTATNSWINSTADQNVGTFVVPQEIPGLGSVSGSGYLAEVTMRAIGPEGSASDIGFDYNVGQRVLSNVQAEEITAEWAGASVRVTGP